MKDSLWTQLGRRPDLPTYVGGWLASLAWLAVVGSTVGDAPFNLLIFGLTTVGFGVSLWLRGFQGTNQWPAIRKSVLVPSVVFRVLFMLGCVLPGLMGRPPFNALVPDVAVGTDTWLIGTGFMWAMALYSFGLVSDGLVAFASVLGLSMLGLMASANVNPEVGLAFLTFLLGNILMLSNMTLAHHSPRRRQGPGGKELSRWVGDQLIVAGLTVSATAVLGIGLAYVLQVAAPQGLIPRLHIGGSLLGRTPLSSGYASFSEQMVIGVGDSPNSDRPVFVARAPEPLLWRRRVYDVFSGHVWTPSLGGQEQEKVAVEGPAVIQGNLDKAREMKAVKRIPVGVSYASDNDLAAPALVTSIILPEEKRTSRITVDRYGDLLVNIPAQTPVQFESLVPRPTPDQLRAAPAVDPADWGQWLRVPVTSRAAVVREAAILAAGKQSKYEIAAAIQNWLETEFLYDAAAKVPERAEDAMAWYFRTRRGACDLIASAMVLLARANDIPAHVAVGYSYGKANGDGTYVVRIADAHAWAELYFPGYGWIPFNPAVPLPAGAQEQQQQQATGGWAGLSQRSLLGLACVAMGLWLLQYVLRAWRRGQPQFVTAPSGRVEAAYHQAQRALLRAGLPRRPSETARQYLRRLEGEDAAAPWLAPFGRLTELLEWARYGFGLIGPAEQNEADALVGSLRKELGRRKPPKRGRGW